jgi:hypothetical protein
VESNTSNRNDITAAANVDFPKFSENLTQQLEIPDGEYTKLSESISQPLGRLFKIGGLILVFTYVGLLSMMLGYLVQSSLSNWFFGVGVIITIFCLALFAFPQIYGPVKAKRLLKANEQLLDSIQDISIRLTETIYVLQSLMFKHCAEITTILEELTPLLTRLPVVNRVNFSQTVDVSATIVTATERSRAIILDVRDALITAKVDRLRQYASQLEGVRHVMEEALSQKADLELPSYREVTVTRELTEPLRNAILTYARNTREINDQVLSKAETVNGALRPIADVQFVKDMLGQPLEFMELLEQVLQEYSNATDCLEAAVTDGDIGRLQQCLVRLSNTSTKLKELSEAAPKMPKSFRQ